MLMRAHPNVLQALVALAAGLAQAASLAWPGNGAPLWWLQLASLAVLAWLLRPGAGRALAWRRGALIGGLFAMAWLAGTLWWLFISMHVYGGLPAPLAVAAVLGLAAFMASFYATAAGLFCHLAPGGTLSAALLFAALWLLAELVRGNLWTGLPWGAGGYAHVDGPLSPLARWGGVYGVGAVAAGVAMLAAQARRAHLRSRRAWALVLAGGTLLAAAALARHCALGACDTTPRPEPVLSLALLQGNIPQDEKFQPGGGVAVALEWYADALRNAKADLVVTPETALPLVPGRLPPGYLDGLRQHYAQGSQAALLGIPLNDAQGYSNSVLGLSPGMALYRYDKHHLVPFGEFIPPFFKWFMALLRIPLGDFGRGAVVQAPFEWAGQRIAPNICYEDLFGEELGARFANPAWAPTVFVNFSNIAWFGNTVAIDQHLHISRMRALEFERPMVRATNTGATAIIDYRGRVTHQLARHTRGVLTGTVQGRGFDAQSGSAITPYAWWVSRWGLWPLWILGAVVLAIAAAAQRGLARRTRRSACMP
ncbi:apolipoprotein N-acyltransferase [Verminephrobacter aporrectodeae]|uniref:apolipoprotein N-acyltransferase n=1 Tax=Verminephrobacter aporrectodeae TaxID=1110389 RepID=UPI003908A7AE